MWLFCCDICREAPENATVELREFVTDSHVLTIAARRQEIIKMTEQLIDSINTGDFEGYT